MLSQPLLENLSDSFLACFNLIYIGRSLSDSNGLLLLVDHLGYGLCDILDFVHLDQRRLTSRLEGTNFSRGVERLVHVFCAS